MKIIRYLALIMLTTQTIFAMGKISFDESMQTASYPFCKEYRNAAAAMNLFHSLYDELADAHDQESHTLRIPHIIHHIWLGSPLPEQYARWRETWINTHPDWQYILWTDNEANYQYGTLCTIDDIENTQQTPSHLVIDIRSCKLQTHELIDRADNYGQRSDIVRYEILYRIGGLYVDTDFSCERSFDRLHAAYDFFIGIQPLAFNLVQLGIGLIGAIPKHPILAHTLEQLASCDLDGAIVLATGPLFFTKMFCLSAGHNGYRDIAFPPPFFYPWNYTGHDENDGCTRDTYAIHHWHGSWMKPQAFIPRRHQ